MSYDPLHETSSAAKFAAADYDGLLPSQLGDRQGAGLYAQERKLWAAVLWDAVYCWQHPGKSANAQKAHREAVRWVDGAECPYSASYAAVCEALDINPDYLRAGLTGGARIAANRRNPTVRLQQITGTRERVRVR